MSLTTAERVRVGTVADLNAARVHGRQRRRPRHRRVRPRRALLRGRQPLPAHGLPAQPRHGARRPADLPLAPRALRPRGRRHARPVRRQRAQLSRRRWTATASSSCSTTAGRPSAPRAGSADSTKAWSTTSTLVLAKATLALLGGGAPAADIVRTVGRYGLRYRGRGWGMGMTILTAVGERAAGAGGRRSAAGAVSRRGARGATTAPGSAPRFDLEPLPATDVAARAPEGVVPAGGRGARRGRRRARAANRDRRRRVARPTLADMLLAAATDHVYLDAGHVARLHQQSLRVPGPGRLGRGAADVLPSLVSGLCQRAALRGAERLAQPDRPGRAAGAAPASGSRALDAGPRAARMADFDTLVAAVLEDDPSAGVAAISAALERGVAVAEIGQAVAHAAALRIGRFHDQQRVRRLGHRPQHVDLVSGAGAGARLARRRSSWRAGCITRAMRIYLDRFLNVPAARLPDERAGAPTASPHGAEDCSSCWIASSRWRRPPQLVDAALARWRPRPSVMRTPGPRAAARGRRVPRLPDARGWRSAVHGAAARASARRAADADVASPATSPRTPQRRGRCTRRTRSPCDCCAAMT